MKYVKSYDEVMRILAELRATISPWRDNGFVFNIPGASCNFNSNMLTYCGKPTPEKWRWLPIFLEEREEE